MSGTIAIRGWTRRVAFVAAGVVAVVVLGACKAPTWSTASQDFSLRILFPMDAADASRSVHGSRLLLPNATSLDVAMEPLDFRFTPLESLVAIPSGATSVVVPFTRVPEGSWKVTATASDAGGAKLFSQTKTIDISAANASFDLPLLPLLSTGLQSTGSAPSQFASVDVPAHDSLSWTIPVEAIKADGSFEIWLDPSTGLKGAYIQYADGRNASYPVSASGAGSYVTVYNPTGAPARALLLLDPYHVNYDGNQTGYQNATGTAPKDVDSAGYAKGYGPSTDYPRATVLGAANLAVKGYSFSGWNTGASGSGRAYAVGDPLTVTSDTLLYAQWAQIHVTGIALNKATDTLLVGATDTLAATVSPSGALDTSVIWTSSDPTSATVANGTVTAVALGSATITAKTTDGGFTASCLVRVTNVAAPVTGVTVSPTSQQFLRAGLTATLVATVSPAGATDSGVSWSSDNTAVATVDAAGLVTAVAAGTATITAKTNDGGYTASCAVTVGTAGTITATFTISSDLTQALGFSPAPVTVTSPGTLTLATSNATLASQGSGWRWSVDGIVDPGATTSSYVFTASAANIGQHIVSVSCLYNGMRYSGNLMVGAVQ